MTFKDLLLDVYRRVGYDTAPETRVSTRIKGFINETQMALASDVHLAPLSVGNLQLTTSSGRAEYGIPTSSRAVVSIRETTNDRRLEPRSRDWYRTAYPDPDQLTGTPDSYVLLGASAVARQPSDASQLWVASSSGSDTAILHFEVRVTSGTIKSGACQLNGITPVSFDATMTTAEDVMDWFLDTEAVGTITLREDSSIGTILAQIDPGQTRVKYQTIAFIPTPSSAITYQIEYERPITNLVMDGDEPFWLPERFHHVLAIGARMREYEYKSDPRYQTAATEYGSELMKLHRFVNMAPDGMPVMGTRQPYGVSRLGAWFPPDTWISR